MDRLVLFVIAVAIAFGLSLINAIIGLIAVLCSKKLDETEIEVKKEQKL